MRIGFIGLGKMGSRMAQKLLVDGHEVVVWNRTAEVVSDFIDSVSKEKYQKNLTSVKELADLPQALGEKIVIWMMLPAGTATESAIATLAKVLKKNDILIDGGNAHFSDTQKRFDTFSKTGIRFLGIGVSGGIKANDNGYPLMIGGDESAFKEIIPILDSLKKPNGGYEYFGSGGSGHFIKMVHNGIEYGMMQAIGEGFGVLEKAPYSFDLVKVSKLWQQGTIVTSFLMDCAKDALAKDSSLSKLDGVIDATGEAQWTVEEAKKEEVYAENIEQSLDFRRRSKTDKNVSSSFAARMVAALRQEFGGHSVTKK